MRALLAGSAGGGKKRNPSLRSLQRGGGVGRPRWTGLGVALLAIVLDQISKPLMRDWLSAGDVQVSSFLSLVLAWDKGVGFSLLTMSQAYGPYILSGLALAIAAVMLFWLLRTTRLLPALSLGLIIGGALGNVIDRL